MQLSPHFSLAELTVTETGLANTPNAQEVERLKLLAAFMEKVRAELGNRPIAVNSAFRSEAVNLTVHGVPNSAHRLAYACDFTVAGMTPYEVCVALDHAANFKRIVFDQLIQEGTWTHISRDPQARGQRLTKIPGGYENGIFR